MKENKQNSTQPYEETLQAEVRKDFDIKHRRDIKDCKVESIHFEII